MYNDKKDLVSIVHNEKIRKTIDKKLQFVYNTNYKKWD